MINWVLFQHLPQTALFRYCKMVANLRFLRMSKICFLSIFASLITYSASFADVKIGNWAVKVGDAGVCHAKLIVNTGSDGGVPIVMQFVSSSKVSREGSLSLEIASEIYEKLAFLHGGTIVELQSGRHVLRQARLKISGEGMIGKLLSAFADRKRPQIAGVTGSKKFFKRININPRGFLSLMYWFGRQCDVYVDDLLSDQNSIYGERLEQKLKMNHAKWFAFVKKFSKVLKQPDLLDLWWDGTEEDGTPSIYLRAQILEYSLDERGVYASAFLSKAFIKSIEGRH